MSLLCMKDEISFACPGFLFRLIFSSIQKSFQTVAVFVECLYLVELKALLVLCSCILLPACLGADRWYGVTWRSSKLQPSC